ncbi:MAG TPA: MFS transporter [Methylomirabilota bacterium]|nr:MFS transporter [Methylomirabilota bacterium]
MRSRRPYWSDTEAAAPDTGYAWVMLALGTVLVALNLGALSSLSVFLKPLSEEFGWPRGATALSYTTAAVTIGVAGVFWGRVADRYGTRPVVLVGVLAQPTALLLLSWLASLSQFYVLYMALGGFGFAAVNVPIIANVGLWFVRRKGLALGILSSGGPLGQALVAFLAAHVVEAYGWRTAYLTLAILYALFAVPLALLVRTPPLLAAGEPATRGGSQDELPLPAPVVVAWLSAAAVFCCTTMSIPIVHTVAMLTDRGLPYAEAARIFVVIMGSGVLGRIFLGRLTDYLGGLRSYFLASALQTALVFWFTRVESLPLLYLLSALFGLGFSGVMTSVWVCVREMVPPRLAATSLAVVVMFAWFGMGLGGWHGGHVFDLTGGYTHSYFHAVLSGLVNLVILGALYWRVSRARARVAAVEAAGQPL